MRDCGGRGVVSAGEIFYRLGHSHEPGRINGGIGSATTAHQRHEAIVPDKIAGSYRHMRPVEETFRTWAFRHKQSISG